MQKKVSIVIPVYNRLNLLKGTIKSVLNQTFSNFELILVNDFSTAINGNDFAEIENFDKRIKVFHNYREKGAPGARNTGLDQANGEYIMFFDADNIMDEKLLEKLVTFLMSNSHLGAVSCCSHVLNDNSEIIDTFTWRTDGYIFEDLIHGNVYADTSSVLYKRESILGVYWDEELMAYQELDFNLSVSSKGILYGTYWSFLVKYYRWSHDTISSDNIKAAQGRLYILFKWEKEFVRVLGRLRYLSMIFSVPNWQKMFIDYSKKFGRENSNFWYFLVYLHWKLNRLLKKCYELFGKNI